MAKMTPEEAKMVWERVELERQKKLHYDDRSAQFLMKANDCEEKICKLKLRLMNEGYEELVLGYRRETK
jgi:hypothetical protein